MCEERRRGKRRFYDPGGGGDDANDEVTEASVPIADQVSVPRRRRNRPQEQKTNGEELLEGENLKSSEVKTRQRREDRSRMYRGGHPTFYRLDHFVDPQADSEDETEVPSGYNNALDKDTSYDIWGPEKLTGRPRRVPQPENPLIKRPIYVDDDDDEAHVIKVRPSHTSNEFRRHPRATEEAKHQALHYELMIFYEWRPTPSNLQMAQCPR